MMIRGRAPPFGRSAGRATSTGFGWNSGVLDLTLVPVERPAVGLAPQPVEDRELVLEQVGALLDRRERQPELAVLGVVPAGARRPTSIRPPLISSTVVTSLAKLPGCRNVTGETSAPSRIRSVSRARPARTAQASVVGWPAGPGKLGVVVGAEERLEAGRLGAPRDGELVLVRQALLGLDHQREAHRSTSSQCSSTRSVHRLTDHSWPRRYVHVMRSIPPGDRDRAPRRARPRSRPSSPKSAARSASSAARRAGRLVQAGVSMTPDPRHVAAPAPGELTMSRLAELLDVSLSNATGLIDRMEERGLVERDPRAGRPSGRPGPRHRGRLARARRDRALEATTCCGPSSAGSTTAERRPSSRRSREFRGAVGRGDRDPDRPTRGSRSPQRSPADPPAQTDPSAPRRRETAIMESFPADAERDDARRSRTTRPSA